MALPLPAISSLPKAPNLADPANFQDDAATFVGALASFRSSINSMIDEINNGLSNASILGTVGQSSGSPTGSLFEPGSNSNGTYVRFADGTQICTSNALYATAANIAVSTCYRTADMSWIYPASFVGEPRLSASCRSEVNHWATVRPISGGNTTEAVLRGWAAAGPQATAWTYVATAVGRWF